MPTIFHGSHTEAIDTSKVCEHLVSMDIRIPYGCNNTYYMQTYDINIFFGSKDDTAMRITSAEYNLCTQSGNDVVTWPGVTTQTLRLYNDSYVPYNVQEILLYTIHNDAKTYIQCNIKSPIYTLIIK